MRPVSFSDMLTFPYFEGVTEDMLLQPHMDKHVAPYLHLLGGDIDYPYEIIASQHRNLNNRIVIGYRYILETRTDYNFIHSTLCETIDRISAAAYKDPSLAIEMASLMGQSVDFNCFHEAGVVVEDGSTNLPQDQLEDDFDGVSGKIKALQERVLVVRGNQRTESGGLKGLKDYE